MTHHSAASAAGHRSAASVRLPGQINDDAGLTRSEEQLRITTHRRETARARLTKYVETEMVTHTVPVRREMVRIDYEPISAGGEAQPAGSSASGGQRWMVLYQEEVVVQTRWVATERVRLATHSVTEDHEISERLRTERIDLDAAERPR